MDLDSPSHPVLLNIYDMFWTNQYTSMLGVGVFHTGLEVCGTEFSYGGHPFEFSGIFEITPKDAEELGEHYKFKESVLIGHTSFTKDEIRQAVSHLGRDFKGISYHLMSKNCNHFSAEMCQLLCGKDLPHWVNRLAYVSSCIPFLEKCIPKEWLTPCALEETVKQQQATNAASTASTDGQNSGQGPSSSRGSTSEGNGNGGRLLTFFEMIRGPGPSTPPATATSNNSNGNGFVDKFLASCNGSSRRSSGSSEPYSAGNSPRGSIASTDSKQGLLQRFPSSN